MLALLGSIFGNAFQGWTRLNTTEGISLLFPRNATRVTAEAETPLGPMTCSVYTGLWNNSNCRSILIVRDYQSETPLESEALFSNWQTDFNDAMQVSGVFKHLVQENYSQKDYDRYDLLYANEEETAYTRVCLIARNNRLIVLYTVGMFQEVMDNASSECFRSIRV